MMKKGMIQHRKTKRLARHLGIPLPHAVGLIAMLWDWASSQSKTGDLSMLSNEEIADEMGWEGDPEDLVGVLLGTGWLDEHPAEDGGYVIHDWLQHCEHYIVRDLKKSGHLPADWERKQAPQPQKGVCHDRVTTKSRQSPTVPPVGPGSGSGSGSAQGGMQGGDDLASLKTPEANPFVGGGDPFVSIVSASERYYHQSDSDEAWLLVPKAHQRGRTKFRDAWCRARRKDADPAVMRGALTAYYAAMEGREFVRLPATFIEQEGYDEPPEAWGDPTKAAAAGKLERVIAQELERGGFDDEGE